MLSSSFPPTDPLFKFLSPQRLLFFLNRSILYSLHLSLKTNKKALPHTNTKPFFNLCNPFHIFSILFQYFLSHCSLPMARVGQESGFKACLVTQICSISTRSIACTHRQGCSLVESPFIDWYHILGVCFSFLFVSFLDVIL